MAFACAEAPAEQRQVFDIVAVARCRGAVHSAAFGRGQGVQGFEVDDAARPSFRQAGYGGAFHRTGLQH
ncbi:MAG: hypothetical protein IPM84_15020 [Anaerolineae bacterium]|nr:hypothetical protein [Anaerolineae bacterium]